MEAALTIRRLAGRRPALALAVAIGAAALLAPAAAAALPPAAAIAAEPSPKEPVLLGKLRDRIAAVDARLDGVLGVYVEDLATGAKIEVRADEPFPTASSIKLAVLYELYRQAQEGRVDLRKLIAPPPKPVQSEGILRFMNDETRLTVRDLGLLVMTLSDNEAANELIRQVGMENVNRRLDGLSLRATRLRRLMMDLEAARAGRENVSTPRELAALARVVGTGEGLRPDLAADLALVATTPDPASYVRRALPEEHRAVAKAGTLEGVRCETAWVDVPNRPYVLAVMTTYVRHERDAEAAITEVSSAAYETFDRLARASTLGRVISERETAR